MKTRIHSPNLVRILFISVLVILLAMGGISPARALQPASQVYAADPQSGIDCGCTKIGPYVDPVAPDPLGIQRPLESPNGKYHVTVDFGSTQINSISVRNSVREIVWLGALPLGTYWTFSPDGDRFALYATQGSQTDYYLYNLARETNPGVPVWDTLTTLADTEAAFSPNGLYFQYAWVDFGMTYLMILDAQTGQSIYQTSFIAAPPPSGDEVQVASWGYSPDDSDRTFVYAYVNSQTVSSVYWAVVNLATGARVREMTMTNAIGSQGLLPFWQFSPCGDAIGLVNPSGSSAEVQLYATKDGGILKPGGVTVSAATFTLMTNTIIHYIDPGSNDITPLANNTADEDCSGGGGGGTTPRPSGIDCGCSATGSYKNPAAPAPLTLQPVNSPHGKYRVAWQYGTDIISSLTVSKISDTGTWQVIFELNMLPTSTHWGFSADDDRFALYSIQTTISGSQTSYSLYNLVRETNPGIPIWQITTPMLDTEAAFSPHGRYFQYAWVNNGMTYLTIRDARTAELIYQTNFTAAPPPGDNKFRVASWGYSPDLSDRTFVYAYVNGQVVSSVYWGVVNLAIKTRVREETLVNAISGQTILPFWKFSPCGDSIGLVNTGLNSTNVQLFATKDGTPLNAGGLDIMDTYSLTLKNNLTSHLADTGSTTYTLADNTADLACSVTPGEVGLKSLSIGSESVTGGNAAQGTVSLTQPAPSGGVTVSLASDNSAAQVPSTVKVLYGNSSASFTITTSEVSAETTTYISALLGETTNTATLTLTSSPIASLTMSHYGIIAGATETATVTLRDPAPAGGAVVNFSTSGAFHTLNWVRIPAGETSATFDVTANLYVSSPQARLTATYLSASKMIDLTILRASSLTVTPAEVTGGADAVTVTAVLPAAAPDGGIAVPLNVNPVGIVELPPSLTIESGQTTGSITASTIAIDENTDVTILAGVPDDTESPSAVVRVLASIPNAFPGGPYIVLAGQPVTLTGDGIDPKGETLTFAWDLNGDETFETAGATAIFTDTAGHNREIPIWLRACNTSGYCGTGLTFVRVRNPGQVWITPPTSLQDILLLNNDWGLPDGPTPFMLEDFGQVIDVVGGDGFIAALKADGTVWTMGDNYFGQTGNEDVPTGMLPDGHRAASNVPVQAAISDVVSIASAGEHVMALKRDGTVWTWGSNRYLELADEIGDQDPHPTPRQVKNLNGVVSISASKLLSFAMTRKGEIYGWGYGNQVFGPGCYTVSACKITTIREAMALEVSNSLAIVLKRDGTVWFWGLYDQVTYEDRLYPVQIEGLSGITAISASGGTNSSSGGTLLALKNDGTVWGIGKNSEGQLGRNPWPDYLKEYIEPLQIPGLAEVRALASGDALQSALLPDGTVVGWGKTGFGCPTDGCGEFWLPTPLAGLANVQAISVGDDFRLAIIPATVTPIVYDNFDDNLTNPSLWSIEQQGGPVAVEMNQRLEITLPADSVGTEFKAWYLSACQLRGDYDIRVDYEVLTWPSANGARIGLADDHANMQRISSRGQPYDISGGPDLYLTTFDTASHIVGITPTSDHFGKLRLERVADTLNSYYFANNTWTPVASYSDPAYAQDTYFYIGSFSGTPAFAGQEIKIAFDNMIVNAGELVCPTTAAPDLAITQVADQETVSSGDPIGFTISITNNSETVAGNVTLTDTLPTVTGLSWSVGGTDAASCEITAGVLSCNFGDMPSGALKTIKLTSLTPTDHAFCSTISNTATVMADNQPEGRNATASTTVLYPGCVTVQPGEAATLTLPNGQGQIEFPADIVTLPTTFTYTEQEAPSQALGGYTFAGLSFTLVATDSDGNLVTSFPASYTIRLTYQDSDWQDAGITDESLLNLAYWDTATGQWSSILPCEGCSLDTEQNRLVAVLNHLTEFALLAPTDTTPPVITPDVQGTQGANGWYTSDVTLSWVVSDAQSSTGCEPVAITSDQAATQYTCSADSAGGASSASVTIGRDATRPATTVTGVTEGATYNLGSVPQAGCATTDNLSGVAAEATLALTGGDAQGVGDITATCSGALDSAGNAADLAVVHFTVVNPVPGSYNFTGFFQPVDNPGEGPSYVFNSVKAGSGVPVKFSLGGDQSLDIFATGFPKSQPVSCTTAAIADPIEQTVTAGGSSLSYDPASDTYTYVWKTDKRWARTCRVLTVQFDDGTQHLAYFQFK